MARVGRLLHGRNAALAGAEERVEVVHHLLHVHRLVRSKPQLRGRVPLQWARDGLSLVGVRGHALKNVLVLHTHAITLGVRVFTTTVLVDWMEQANVAVCVCVCVCVCEREKRERKRGGEDRRGEKVSKQLSFACVQCIPWFREFWKSAIVHTVPERVVVAKFTGGPLNRLCTRRNAHVSIVLDIRTRLFRTRQVITPFASHN